MGIIPNPRPVRPLIEPPVCGRMQHALPPEEAYRLIWPRFATCDPSLLQARIGAEHHRICCYLEARLTFIASCAGAGMPLPPPNA